MKGRAGKWGRGMGGSGWARVRNGGKGGPGETGMGKEVQIGG